MSKYFDDGSSFLLNLTTYSNVFFLIHVIKVCAHTNRLKPYSLTSRRFSNSFKAALRTRIQLIIGTDGGALPAIYICIRDAGHLTLSCVKEIRRWVGAYRSSRLFAQLRPVRINEFGFGSGSVGESSGSEFYPNPSAWFPPCCCYTNKYVMASCDLGMLQACVDKNYFEHRRRVHNLRTMNEQVVATVFLITSRLQVRL